MKAHAEVSVRDCIEDSVRARTWTQTILILRADDVIMVWKTNPPSKRGWWVGPGVCIGTHRGSVWVNMRVEVQPVSVQIGHHRRVPRSEIQNQLFDDMKAEFQEFPGRRENTMWSATVFPPADAERLPAASRRRGRQDLALIPTLPPVTSPPPSLPEIDSESQRSFREALQNESATVLVPPQDERSVRSQSSEDFIPD